MATTTTGTAARRSAFTPRPAPAPLAVAAREYGAGTLAAEVARYLAAVSAFRAEDCAPHWRAEHEEVEV